MKALTSEEVGQFLQVIPITVSANDIAAVIGSRENFEAWKAQSQISAWMDVYRSRMGTEAQISGMN